MTDDRSAGIGWYGIDHLGYVAVNGDPPATFATRPPLRVPVWDFNARSIYVHPGARAGDEFLVASEDEHDNNDDPDKEDPFVCRIRLTTDAKPGWVSHWFAEFEIVRAYYASPRSRRDG